MPGVARLRKREPRRVKPVKPSRATELWYRHELLAIVRLVSAEIMAEIPPLLALYAQAQDGSLIAADDIGPRYTFNSAFDRLVQRFGDLEGQLRVLASEAVRRAGRDTDNRLAKNVHTSIGIDIKPMLGPSERLTAAMGKAARENAKLITGLPAQYVNRVKKAVLGNLSAGKRFTDVASQIEAETGIAERRAKFIARDQISKMNGEFNQIRQEEAGFEEYEWQTSGDERVRDSHAELDGKRFRWDAPPLVGHPGEDIMCRCVAIPVINI